MDALGSNTGYFITKNISKDGSTTEGHEFGHGYGLPHPAVLDIRGAGKPGIMYPRGTLVDPKYQWNSNAAPGAAGGTMNPDNRQVNQQDINDLGLEKLNYDQEGKADLGKITNTYHQEEVGDGK